MSFLLLGTGLLLHWIFWGVGAAMLALPLGCRRLTWALAVPFGLSLQIAVVWFIGVAGGTVAGVGPWTQVLPVILLAAALSRRRNRCWLAGAWRTREAMCTASVAVLALLVALLPAATSAVGGGELTTFSFGSCDAPDYAMGVRLLLEQGRDASGGFWSQAEVHQLPGGISLWSYWTRLNHFGAAGLVAMAVATFRLEAWQVMTVLAAALGSAGAPLAFAFGRSALGLRWIPSLAVAVLCALSPLVLYAVYNVALGQLTGMLGVVALLLLALRQSRMRWRRNWIARVFSCVLPLWLLLSSYPVMTIFAVAIIAGIAAWHALERRSWVPLARTGLWLAGGAVVCAALFPARFAGSFETLGFYGGGAFGWPIGPIQLPGIVGLTADELLNSHGFRLAAVLFLVFGGSLAMGLLAAWRRRDPALAVSAVGLGAITGACFLMSMRDPLDAELSSYKIYKLTAVFLPALLPCLFIALKPWPFMPQVRRGLILLLVAVVAVWLPAPLKGMRRLARAMPLRVTPGIAGLGEFDRDPAIEGVNIVAEHPWLRLWASALLANRRQFFAESTYISRGPGPLLGNWVLEDDRRGIYSAATRRFDRVLALRRVDDPPALGLTWGEGWWSDEGGSRWSGSAGAVFSFVVEAAGPMKDVKLELKGRLLEPDTRFRAFVDGRELDVVQDGSGNVAVGLKDVSAGSTEVTFRSNKYPSLPANRNEARTLLYRVESIDVSKSGP